MIAPRFLAYVGEQLPWATPTTDIDGMEAVPLDGPIHLRATEHLIRLGTQGAVLGHLFTRTLPSRQITHLNAAEISAAFATQGQSLIRDYWGGYIAIFKDFQDDIWIVRDPSGTMPAFWREVNGGIAITPQLGAAPFAASQMRVDLDALLVHIWNPFYSGERTCVAGVRELMPGCRLRITPTARSSNLLWQPWNFIPDRTKRPMGSVDMVRKTIFDAIGTWAAMFPSILSGLSGGLDSSIIATGLHHSGAHFRGLHMNSPDREGDELRYAQLLAKALDIPLDIFSYDPDAIDVERPIVAHAARPFMAHYAQSTAKAQALTARQQGIDAYFTGHGGDNVFALMHSVAPILDRFQAGQDIAAVLRTIRDVAQLHDADYLTILLHLVRRLKKPSNSSARRGDRSFLDDARLEAAIDAMDIHPWLLPPDDIPAGSATHVRALARAVGHDGFHDRRSSPPSISPLLAQPVMELCLGIPSWHWVEGGIDRSVARQAFQSYLPPLIAARRTKGGPAGFLDRYYWENETQILSHLRSGLLAQSGLIRDLPSPGSTGGDRYRARRIIGLAGAESWARHWTT